MTSYESMGTKFQESFGAEIVQNSKVYLNLSQEVIVITEDKFRLCLQGHKDRLVAKQRWLAPVSLFVTLLIVFATSTFRDFVFPAATWQAVFLIGVVGTAVWSIVATVKSLRSNTNIDTFVNEVKKTSEALKRQ